MRHYRDIEGLWVYIQYMAWSVESSPLWLLARVTVNIDQLNLPSRSPLNYWPAQRTGMSQCGMRSTRLCPRNGELTLNKPLWASLTHFGYDKHRYYYCLYLGVRDLTNSSSEKKI